jgi:nucleoid DNA-binding protein
MFNELYQYLVLHRQVNLPGVGVFQLERKPADLDFANKVVNPPYYTVALHHGNESIPAKQINWFADILGIPDTDVPDRISAFTAHLKNEILNGKRTQWTGIGTLSKGLAGEIRFEAELKDSPAGEPVPAAKVLREKAAHTVRVGEQEKTSEEMIEFLQPAEKKRSYEWIITLIVALLALAFLIWHFMQTGLGNSTGNQQKVQMKQESVFINNNL